MSLAEDQAALDAIEVLIQDGTDAVATGDRSHHRDLDALQVEADRLRRKIANGGRSGRMRKAVYNSAFTG